MAAQDSVNKVAKGGNLTNAEAQELLDEIEGDVNTSDESSFDDDASTQEIWDLFNDSIVGLNQVRGIMAKNIVRFYNEISADGSTSEVSQASFDEEGFEHPNKIKNVQVPKGRNRLFTGPTTILKGRSSGFLRVG